MHDAINKTTHAIPQATNARKQRMQACNASNECKHATQATNASMQRKQRMQACNASNECKQSPNIPPNALSTGGALAALDDVADDDDVASVAAGCATVVAAAGCATVVAAGCAT